jgi:hypothetical protein
VIELLIAEARRYIGVAEKPPGSNRGIEVDYYNWQAIGDWRPFPMGGQGAPWCASFVSQIGVQALGRSRWPIPVTAIAQAMVEWGEGKQVTSPMPHKGDVFALYYPTKGRHGHVGIVTGLLPDNRFATIEGNSNRGGSREGYAVVEQSRPVTDRCTFIRWVEVAVTDGGHI